MADWITKTLYIGTFDSTNPRMAEVLGMPLIPFHAVVRLDPIAIAAHTLPDSMTTLDVPINDAEPVPNDLFPRVTRFIDSHLRAEHDTLVQCHQGISRSATMILAYLIEYEQMTLAASYRLLHDGRPAARPHPALMISLVNHYQLPYTSRDVQHPNFYDTILSDDD